VDLVQTHFQGSPNMPMDG